MNQWILTPFIIACAFWLPKTTLAEPLNLSASKQVVIQYYTSGAYTKELTGIINQATNFLHKRVMQNNQTLHPEKLALILDIDETSLSNFAYMQNHDFGYDPVNFHQHVLLADDEALQPTLSSFHDAQKQGVAVFFITGRPLSEAAATKINLHKVGFDAWNGIFFKPNNCIKCSTTHYKSEIRKNIEEKGYKIIASLGDQMSDHQGGYREKYFKLPNPWYIVP